MSASVSIQATKVTFPHQFTSMTGSQPKEWFEIPGATHHLLYDDDAAVGKAVAKLGEFFDRSL